MATTAEVLRLAATLVEDAATAGLDVPYVNVYAGHRAHVTLLTDEDPDADALAAALRLEQAGPAIWEAEIDGLNVRTHRKATDAETAAWRARVPA
ncbi:hypothetical protein Xcel_0592 [Xylanimonas cellulosilytica DSM 15894]|uniref:Uncharacterized protein n=1 Tax=Xylanimonas cellulosilytica (strain DSM 15894 / JCM 12276 / CECT 5975 / KCTC 9989 / LMG 20990 / NBRC 107835 / XIL07) TaxID=446471 RepID=D1BWP9_XYLCX|nr:hypothetical protein [Xylanimonas cellulosilytica]ACZ29631.1 hypothetical protein Xcel_0592 [Xylanimonas cellulosilytica DSM 15894]